MPIYTGHRQVKVINKVSSFLEPTCCFTDVYKGEKHFHWDINKLSPRLNSSPYSINCTKEKLLVSIL